MKHKKQIKRGLEVVVISGAHKNKRGKILEVMSSGRALVEGVNLRKRKQPATQENPEGGLVERETSINISNLMVAERFDLKKK